MDQQNSYTARNQSTVAATERTVTVGYGAATRTAGTVARPRSRNRNLRLMSGEILGLCFVAATSLFTLAVPASLARPGALRNRFNAAIKRSVDIVGAVVGLILTLPVWLILPLVIKLDSRGPVFYKQVRIGINRRRADRRFCNNESERTDRRNRNRRRENLMGRPFEVIKFRTMVQDAEAKSGPVWASKNDPRITKIGAFLRKSRLDEIPQFINVLRGDMSLVGPRPERPTFVRELSEKIEDYPLRLDVKPGLTGLAQVENGYDSSLESVVQKVSYDLTYIRTWSLWNDFRIMLKTVVVVFTGRGAH